MNKSYEFNFDNFSKDNIRAIDARYEAQKIAFAPLTYQAIRTLLETGILKLIEESGDDGITGKEISEKSGISPYGVGVLSEMDLGMGVLRIHPEETAKESSMDERYVLGKTGWFLLNDELTRVNFNFCNDICYKGAFNMKESVENGKPEGLKVIGDQWTTIYESLSTLPDREKKSWFEFDHFYSDIAFPAAFPLVFEKGKEPETIVDIGGNTAKWAIACCKYNSDVKVKIVDLPGQTAVAEQRAREEGFSERISTFSGNVLDETTVLPENADAYWMSQFLDCFSLKQITKILTKVYKSASEKSKIYVLEPLIDRQKYEGNAYSVMATSLYFTCMANGNSKMYRYGELKNAIEKSGFRLIDEHHDFGSQAYSLLVFGK